MRRCKYFLGSADQIDDERLGDKNAVKTLKVPLTDLTIKSKAVDKDPFRLKIDPELNSDPVNELSSSAEEDKTKTDDTETTKYFCFRKYYRGTVCVERTSRV